MKRFTLFFLICILFSGLIFASDFGTGFGFSFYGNKEEKLSRQNGYTVSLNYNFYRSKSYIDIFTNVSASFGKHGYIPYYENSFWDSLDGLHSTFMLGGKIQLSSIMAFKAGFGAVASIQTTEFYGWVYDRRDERATAVFDSDIKFGPSGYMMLDIYGLDAIVFKAGCIFGIYVYGCTFNHETQQWGDWGSYVPNGEYFVWPQVAISLYW